MPLQARYDVTLVKDPYQLHETIRFSSSDKISRIFFGGWGVTFVFNINVGTEVAIDNTCLSLTRFRSPERSRRKEHLLWILNGILKRRVDKLTVSTYGQDVISSLIGQSKAHRNALYPELDDQSHPLADFFPLTAHERNLKLLDPEISKPLIQLRLLNCIKSLRLSFKHLAQS